MEKNLEKETSFLGGKNIEGGNIMNKKIVYVIGAISVFIMLSLGNMFVDNGLAAPGLAAPVSLHFKLDVDDGDLWCFEPDVDEIGDGLYNCKVRFRNKDRINIVPGGWEAKVLWHGDPEKEIERGKYTNVVPPITSRDDFHIEFFPVDRGWHNISVVLDCEDICHESDENNNERDAWHLFWW